MGGEFEIDYCAVKGLKGKLPNEFNRGKYYSSGRAALYHILEFSKQLGKNKILLPDFLCESIVEIVNLSEVPFEFYSVKDDFSLDLDSIKKNYSHGCQVLIINYFGGVDVQTEINKVKNIDPGASIILDNVQAFFCMFEEYDVDFMFTSFRKQLPVPDGAWVISKHLGLYDCKQENSFAQFKLAGGILKNFQKYTSVSDLLYIDLFNKGEVMISQNINAKISDITINILSKLDFSSIKNKRVENADFLMEGLVKLGVNLLMNFNKGQVPLFVPIILKNRDAIRKELMENKIYCPIHWPRCKETGSLNQKLYNDELSLVIDQRYSKNEMGKLLSILTKCLNNEK
ncbi:MAG: hypothetical protein KJ754_06055 [Bacteroidetes bacterium]|nr:hypothetical protein [Bacteroidota bacterium]MBU1578973.1 hypothetical protein [Bacteroidota bacterium]